MRPLQKLGYLIMDLLDLVVADQGREFIGKEFTDRLGFQGIPVHFISARAPWENARTEKAGGIFKSRLETVIP